MHLLAELLENAGTYGPDARVRVVGRRTDAGIELAVVDDGIGMPGPHVDRWNRILAASGAAPGGDLSPAIGLAVVGRLAHRMGAAVRLHSEPDTGTCAVVGVPERLLEPVVRAEPTAPQVAGESTASAAPEPPIAAAPVPTAPLDLHSPVTAAAPGPPATDTGGDGEADPGVRFTPVPAPRPGDPGSGGRRRGARHPAPTDLDRHPPPRAGAAPPAASAGRSVRLALKRGPSPASAFAVTTHGHHG